MNISSSIHAIDTHTVGQATRIIIGGIPALKGNSMMEKKQYLAENYDYIRSSTMLEPRGHADMFGALLTEPASKEADMGVIFLDGAGYLNMCGHGTIGVATALVETGMVKVSEPYTDIVLEAPAGLIKVRVKVEDHRAKEVSFVNVPAFLYEKDVKVNVPCIGEVTFDIAFGGSFFAIVKDKQLGVEISTDNLDKNISTAIKFLRYIEENVKVQHPLLHDINKIELVEIYGQPKSVGVDVQNMVVLGEGEVDRSPCGTGTCAKMAVLHTRGELPVGKEFVHESILETRFKGKIIEEIKVADYDAIIPQITGQAYITGFNHFVIDEEDPLKHGFCLRAHS